MSGGNHPPRNPFEVRESIRRKRCIGYRERQVLNFARSWFEVWGNGPSYTEVMAGVGINSKGEVSRIAKSLEERGLFEPSSLPSQKGKARDEFDHRIKLRPARYAGGGGA